MAKLTKVDLSRGTTLAASHWNLNKDQVETLLTTQHLDNENLTLNNGKFSMTFNWPRLIAEDFFAGTALPRQIFENWYDIDTQGLNVPILLPPLQDEWNETIGTQQMPKLVSLSISFDTMMKNYGIQGETASPLVLGLPLLAFPDMANVYECEIEIREKEQWIVYGNQTTEKPANIAPRSIFKTTIAGEFFNGSQVRFNPFFVGDVSLIFHPLKTYLLKINFPKVFGALSKHRFAPISLTVKLDFETRLVPRDTVANGFEPDQVQNYPLRVIDTDAIMVLDTAVAGDKITATAGFPSSGRIQTNIEKVDGVAVAGIPAGFDLRSELPSSTRVDHDSSYFCLAVPMFSMFLDVRAADLNTEYTALPYGDIGAFGAAGPYWNGFLYDQRLIPISQPCTIHHVFAVNDWGCHGVENSIIPIPPYEDTPRERVGAATVPTSPTFTQTIGVGICSALRAESRRYEQVAYAEWMGEGKFDFLVDQIATGLQPPFFGHMNQTLTPGYACDQEIYNVPLVPNIPGGQNERGFYDQGKPYYVGKSDMTSVIRTNVGVVGGGSEEPRTQGRELFLDVRWHIADVGLPAGMSWQTGNADKLPTTQYIGTSKHWIYIIGKMGVAQ